MSRHIFENAHFQVAVGVDHITSTFVQVYDKRVSPVDQKDNAEIVVDNRGVEVYTMIPELELALARLRLQFTIAHQHGNQFPNLHVDDVMLILNPLGMTNHREEVAAILD